MQYLRTFPFIIGLDSHQVIDRAFQIPGFDMGTSDRTSVVTVG